MRSEKYNYGRAMLLLAACYGRLGQTELAKDWFTAAWHYGVSLEPMSPEFSAFMEETASELYGSETPPSKSMAPQVLVDVFDRLITLHPDMSGLWYERGVCHARILNWERAVIDFRKAIELQPAFVVSHIISSGPGAARWSPPTVPDRFERARMVQSWLPDKRTAGRLASVRVTVVLIVAGAVGKSDGP